MTDGDSDVDNDAKSKCPYLCTTPSALGLWRSMEMVVRQLSEIQLKILFYMCVDPEDIFTLFGLMHNPWLHICHAHMQSIVWFSILQNITRRHWQNDCTFPVSQSLAITKWIWNYQLLHQTSQFTTLQVITGLRDTGKKTKSHKRSQSISGCVLGSFSFYLTVLCR